MTQTFGVRHYADMFTDTRRWGSFLHRPGDIVVATPPKCGTTWTQSIIASLLWPEGDAPGAVVRISPWVDGRLEAEVPVAKRLDRQTHRRFVKTHTPADGVPWWRDASYVVVLRDGRDAFMSWMNHVASMHEGLLDALAEVVRAEGVEPEAWTGDPSRDFDLWLGRPDCAPAYLASWWPVRNESNVLLVHYNDLKADLDGQMRRIAAFLSIEVPAELWPAVVERCTFESMRARGEEIAPFDALFVDGTNSFLYKGTNGRWRDVLTPAQLDAYRDRVAATLTPEAAAWVEGGSSAGGD